MTETDLSQKSEKIIIVGPAASGKDYLIQYCIEHGLKRGMKWTTRPSRKGEVEGVDYHFVNDSKFENMITECRFHEWQTFEVTERGHKKTWYYGSTWEDFDEGQVFIKTPAAVEKLTDEQRKRCFIVYLDIPLEVRRNRLIERLNTLDDTDSFERRISGDNKDFEDFKDYDMRIQDPDFDADMILGFLN
jgi:guanylate kinase